MNKLKRFWAAISQGDKAAVAQFLVEKPEWVNLRDANGLTPLMNAVAAMERKVECIDLLIRSGADVNAVVQQGYTALHFAVDVNGPSCHGNTPFQIFRLLVNAGANLEVRQHWGWTPLMRAVVEGTSDEVRGLLAVGANPSHIFPDHTLPLFLRGRTCLMAAIGRPEKLKLLIAAGANINVRDRHNQTAIEYANSLLAEGDNYDFREKVKDSISILDNPKR